MTTPHADVALTPARLPEGAALRREMPLPAARRDDRYVQRFDARTLFYDAFHEPGSGAITLVCPRLLNLWPALRDGLLLDGKPAGRRLRRRVHLRHEVLRLPVAEGATPQLALRIAGGARPVQPGVSRHDLFAGRNCLIAMQKDTPAEWIEDWARWHASAHGADAVLLFDNGSAGADLAALQARLAAVPGIAVARVISAPFPYGDRAGGRFVVPSKFLQTAMLNLARLRFLGRARGVLSLDIDEFMQPLPAGTVFDAAARSPLGLVSFAGRWVHAAGDGPQPQRRHGLRTATGGLSANTKWCASPGRGAARLSWAVHRPGGALFPLSVRRGLGYWHFHATTTGWKGGRLSPPEGLVPAPELRAALAAHLG